MVRNLAKLSLFYSLTFIICFAVVICLKFLTLRVDWIKILPAKPETTFTLFLAAARWALSLSVFSSILITLNYVVRKKYNPLMSIICVMLFSFAFCFGITTALSNLHSVPSRAQSTGFQLGKKGLILSNSFSRNLTEVVLLEGMANPLGPRVVAAPGQPLVFYGPTGNSVSRSNTGQADLTLPPVPFGDDTPWFVQSLDIDIRLNAEMFQKKFSEGILSYLFYSGSFIFLLCALGYVIKFSAWPLANMFLATLAFRGILSFSTFYNTPETYEIVNTFFGNKLPASIILQLIFFIFGALIYLYLFLAYAAKRRDKHDV